MGTVLNVCTKKLQQLFIESEFFHQRPDFKLQLWVKKDTPQTWTICLVHKTKNYITILIGTSGCFFLKTIFLTFCIKLSATLFSFRSQSNKWMSLDMFFALHRRFHQHLLKLSSLFSLFITSNLSANWNAI